MMPYPCTPASSIGPVAVHHEKELSMSDLQAIMDHARLDSVKRYAKTELARKRKLMERRVMQLEERRGRFGVES